jgi:predicted AAA+ superfamily ATPase
MEKQLLREIIIEQKDIMESLNLGIQRDIFDIMKKYLTLPHVVVISGIRRTGKSTLLRQIMEKFYNNNVYYLNFEDERLLNFEVKDFNTLYEVFLELFGEKKIFFFDEIQNVKNREIFVRRMQDSGYKFFITGSNASLLSKELGTKLTGRYVMISLLPFSFREFLRFKGQNINSDILLVTKGRGLIKRFFNEYLEEGGMPEYLKYKDKTILKRTYEDILYRDISVRYEIKSVKKLRELSLYFMSNPGCVFSYNNLKNMLQLGSVNTVKSYITYLENSFLLFTINALSFSLKKQFITQKKTYCIDNGVMNAISFQFSKNKGKFLENMVFIELKRRYDKLYYYKTKNGKEVDFLIKEGRDKKNITLIQVADSLSNKVVWHREVDALLSGMEELKVTKSLILTNDEDETIKIKGKNIEVKSIYKWLI